LASPTIGKLSSMYLHAWKSGLKTTYYLRSRPATRIQQATVAAAAVAAEAAPEAGLGSELGSDEAAVACSLENPESCEACQ
jgi:ribonucleoside-diphosphate reductase alpha chain